MVKRKIESSDRQEFQAAVDERVDQELEQPYERELERGWHNPDGWSKVLGTLSIIGWLIFIAALIVFHYARPEPASLFDEVFGVVVRDNWQLSLRGIFLITMSAGLIVSLLALAINLVMFRQHRTHVWVNLVILIAASTGCLLFYWLAIV